MLPAFALCCRIHILLICIRHSHPADQDPSALSILECLGCIEIKAVVPFPESFFLRLSILQDKVSGLIDVLKTELFSGQSLGRYRKHLLSLKSEKIRALPHIAPFASALCKDIDKFPVEHICRFIQSCLCKSIFACSTDYIIGIIMFPYFRIPEQICWNTFRCCDHRVPFIFFKVDSVFTICDTLCLFKPISIITGSCIDQE